MGSINRIFFAGAVISAAAAVLRGQRLRRHGRFQHEAARQVRVATRLKAASRG